MLIELGSRYPAGFGGYFFVERGIFMLNSFKDLGLQPELLDAVTRLGYEQPTPIQVETIPQMLLGRDVLAQSQTGTGKTAAFMLPILQRLQEHDNKAIKALVLAPTRELAKQVADATEGFARNSQLRVLPIYGGQSYEIQIRALKRGVDIVVGTPGRLLDLMRQGHLDLSQVKTLVLDEADQMLEMGFIDDVQMILEELSEDKQMALFSATLPEPIRKLAAKYLNDPAKILISPNRLTVDQTEQRFYRVREETKLAALACLLETEEVSAGLIFARTKARAQDLADELMRRGFSADSLHGDLNQTRRELVLNRFRQGIITLLVATDVAARGLDISDVSHVFNFDMPADPEDYVHRIGRTGRAGKQGVAITLLTPRERGRMNQIQSYTRQPVNEVSLPTVAQVQERRDAKFMERLSGQLLAGISGQERVFLKKMHDHGFSSEEIAVGLMRLLRAGEKGIPAQDLQVLSADEQKPWKEKTKSLSHREDRSATKHTKGDASVHVGEDRSRGVEPGMVRLWMNLGNRNGLRPGDIVGAIAGESGIPGKAIGEIKILSSYSLVDVEENQVKKVLKASKGNYRLKGKPVLVKVADY